MASCRICFEEYNGVGEDRLFRPCACRGTSSFIHVKCLEACRRVGGNHYYRCSVCLYEYRTARASYAKILEYPHTSVIITILLILASLAVMASAIDVCLLLLGISMSRGVLLYKLVTWSALAIGYLMVLFMLFAERSPAPAPGLDAVIRLIDYPFVHYIISTVGFASFVYRVYLMVDGWIRNMLSQCASYIMEVDE